MSNYGYVIEWFDGCWISKGEGDPCRTLVINNAQIFKSVSAAKARITRDHKRFPHRDLVNSKIYPVLISAAIVQPVSD